MKNLIAYFRGLNAYKKAIAENSDHAVFLDAVKQSNPKQDKLEVVRYRCTIDEEWINQIDIGLDAIAKAIAEERQFILSNGEIVPIEKSSTFQRIRCRIWLATAISSQNFPKKMRI